MSIKDAKLQFLTDEAIELFLERSIGGVTVRDIAQHSGVGEATVYRTFGGRGALILACALKLQARVSERFFAAGRAGHTGFERLTALYAVFPDLLEEEPGLYRFLSEFDAFCLAEQPEGLAEYAENIDRVREVFFSAYEAGVREGSVRPLPDPDAFYYTTTHAMLSLCKKLAAERLILPQDNCVDPVAEARLMGEIVLSYLQNR
ncbi:MAG: helix-turn-helix transcriptional regulator [Clostridia bacterium]|nr:helix-turn-helix transcriptional regulator [Clostridia bacterium]